MRAIRSIAVAGTAIAALVVSLGSAYADPGSAPASTDIVAVGSDTTQLVTDRLSADYNANKAPTHTVPPNFDSWDAVDPTTGVAGGTITTKGVVTVPANPCTITRPNGSGAGISALAKNTMTADGTGFCVDLARSSRNITANDPAGIASDLVAKDLITWSSVSGGNAVTNLTKTELLAIYSCDATLLPTGDHTHAGRVLWSDLTLESGTSSDPIEPVLPQTSSGTRATWLSDIGVTWTTPPSCITNGTFGGNPIEENEGTNAVFSSASSPNFKDIVFPYSAGDYVCQTNTLGFCADIHGSLVLGKIAGVSPTTGSGATLKINTSTFSATFIRSLFFVFRNAGTVASPSAPTYLQGLIGTGSGVGNAGSGWFCGATAQADIQNFGFAQAGHLGSQCGVLTAIH